MILWHEMLLLQYSNNVGRTFELAEEQNQAVTIAF